MSEGNNDSGVNPGTDDAVMKSSDVEHQEYEANVDEGALDDLLAEGVTDGDDSIVEAHIASVGDVSPPGTIATTQDDESAAQNEQNETVGQDEQIGSINPTEQTEQVQSVKPSEEAIPIESVGTLKDNNAVEHTESPDTTEYRQPTESNDRVVPVEHAEPPETTESFEQNSPETVQSVNSKDEEQIDNEQSEVLSKSGTEKVYSHPQDTTNDEKNGTEEEGDATGEQPETSVSKAEEENQRDHQSVIDKSEKQKHSKNVSGTSQSTEKSKSPNLQTSIAENDEPSEIEKTLPDNTPTSPEATIFKVEKTDLQEHTKYIRTFPKNFSPASVKAPTFTDNKMLTPTKDDYVYIKTSEKGETKVTKNGHLLGGRSYIFSTFTLPGRGKKLYVLAAEAARTLGVRDAFILCARLKQLCRHSANEEDRKFLESSGILPSKIRNRTIGLVSAKSLFMNLGARVVLSGKRIVDDYWEDEAVEQGFTEESQVFPVDKNYGPRASHHQRKEYPKKISKPISSKFLMVHPMPSLEERREYIQNASKGELASVLPGQGIVGGVELASVSTIPKYKNENGLPIKGDLKPSNSHRHLGLIIDKGSGHAPLTTAVGGINRLPINDELSGDKSPMGLPYYKKNVVNRIIEEDPAKLEEIEYLHSTVEMNNYISMSRTQRLRQWPYYWQIKAGVEAGMTREQTNEAEYLQKKREFLKVEDVETRFNEYLNCDQVMTKKRKPNPNYIGCGNLSGVKPPYAEKPVQEHTELAADTSAVQKPSE